ncbi:MAG TPA: DUF992 domain-containing protein [Xanthobacteraceae bacterium]|nr:DUF992 domain-containing protein [Xanthobacteraceae bacterium]
MRRFSFALGAVLFALVNAVGGASAQQQGAKIGTLSCDISGGLGMIIASQKTVNCMFLPEATGWNRESYTGSISKFGLDIGGTTGAQMVWAVFAAGSPAPGALAGEYAGATAEATIAVGLGANALIGGSNRSIALQPLSITGQTGLNAAAGVAILRLAQVR